MLIRFENDLSDVLAWVDYHHSQSETFRDYVRSYRRLGLGFAALGVIMSTVMPAFLGMMTVAMGIFLYVSSPPILYSKARSNARLMYEEGPMNGLVGRFEMVVEEDGVEIVSAMERHYYRWEALDRIVQTDTHTFVYVNGLQAYVIPHGSVSEGDPDALLAFHQGRRLGGSMERLRRLEGAPEPAVDEQGGVDVLADPLVERIERASAGRRSEHLGTRTRAPGRPRSGFDDGAEGYI